MEIKVVKVLYDQQMNYV